MSGSGGFTKWRCKYFQTHGCDNWLDYGGGTLACPQCVFAGRESLDPGVPSQEWVRSPEVCFPIVHQGTITYGIADAIETRQTGNYWTFRFKTAQRVLLPSVTTSDTPGIALHPTSIPTHLGRQH